MKIQEIKTALKEILNERTTREIKVIFPVAYGNKLTFRKNARYPMMSDVCWELKKMQLMEEHPEADVLANDEYKLVMLIDGKIEDEK